ncbi:MAG: DUF4097 domain-containing protein [Clostridiales bacterium]|jgi:DUF4097 and DUF4098 domain-containing protein YvlB|nr:DUF4097 domain-containing protein [Clostridiales bacterium]
MSKAGIIAGKVFKVIAVIAVILIFVSPVVLGVTIVYLASKPRDLNFTEKSFTEFDGEITSVDVRAYSRKVVLTGVDGDFSVDYYEFGGGSLTVSFSDGKLTVDERRLPPSCGGYPGAAESYENEKRFTVSISVPKSLTGESALSVFGGAEISGIAFDGYVSVGARGENLSIKDTEFNASAKIDASGEDLNIENVKAARLGIFSHGDLNIKNAEVENAEIETSLGGVTVENLTAEELFKADTHSGDILLDGVFAEEIWVETVDGAQSLKNIEADNIDLFSESGNISVENLSAADGSRAKELKAQTRIGNIGLKDVSANEISIGTTGGGQNLENIDAESIGLESYTGGQSLKNIEAQNVELQTRSGDIECETVSAANFSAKTKQGNIKAEGLAVGDTEFFTVSGNITAEFTEVLGEYSIAVSYSTGSSNAANQTGSTPKTISASTDAGHIKLYFKLA